MASKFSRLSKLGTLTTTVSGSYLSQKVASLFQDEEAKKAALQQAHAKNAERIVSSLGSLKGAAMKVGQALAQAADGLELPPEARQMLGQLHDKAEPVPFDAIRRRIEEELNGDIKTLYKRFDEQPLGTASLGQAHAAELPDGTEVVVKVLHHGIEDGVKADLSAARAMLTASRMLSRPKDEVDAIFVEIEARLAEELNYQTEAANLKEFGGYFKGDPDVRIPQVFAGWSTSKVLTMERLFGRPLTVFASTAPEAARQHAAVTIGRAFLKMQYLHRAIHADPHPGNFLFGPDGSLGLIDFGCVRRFDVEWMANYGQCGLYTRYDDKERTMEAALRINALARRDAEAEAALWDLCRAIGKPFRGGAFTMGGPEDDVQDLVTAIAKRIIANPILRSPPELVYLHRGLAGNHQILKQLKGRADWGEMFERHMMACMADAAKKKV